MRPAERKTFSLPEMTPFQARLLVALGLSFAAHLALVFLLPIRPVSHVAPPLLQVTLEEGRLAATRQVTEVPLVLAAAPETAGAAVPRPRQQAASTLPDVDLAKPAAPPAVAETLPAPAADLPEAALELPLAEDPVYYTARELDRHPAAARPIVPDYPEEAEQEGLEGSVTLRLLIDEKGGLREIAVVDADPPGVFEEAALAAFRAGHFLPGERAGRAVKSRILIKVRWGQGQTRQ